MSDASSSLAQLVAALDRGAPFKGALEAYLAALPADEADARMMEMKESRGAWAVLLERPAPGERALFVGGGHSGTPIALASLGWRVTVLAATAETRAFAVARGAALVPGLVGSAASLEDAERGAPFDLVVREEGLGARAPRGVRGATPELAALRRLAARTLLVVADNRFGYKRSTGRRGDFDKRPARLLREALAPSGGERGLSATRRAVQGEWSASEAFAPYPHAREFSHVVALDAPRPTLTLRRRERSNRLKMLGHRLGLFPHLTPSFTIVARRSGPAPERLVDGVLTAVAAATGEPRGEVDVVVATRSNDAIVHTALPGAGEDEPAGRWTIHFPLQPEKRRMALAHHGWLTRLADRFPTLPVPEPLYAHEGGDEMPAVAVERRLPGITGADLTGDRSATTRMFQAAAEHFAALVVEPARPLDAERFDSIIGARVEIAARHSPTESTRRALWRLCDTARERMLGRPMPLTVYHADLRAKHVQVSERGEVLGYLDWGASEEAFVPYVDVLHLVLHQRKQEEGGSFGDAWALVRDGDRLRAHERDALDRYCALLGLDDDLRAGIEQLYPAFVAGMAERNWDYSRPDWVHRQFGL